MAGCLLRPRPLVLQQLRHSAAFTRLLQISFSATKSALEMAPKCRCQNHGPYDNGNFFTHVLNVLCTRLPNLASLRLKPLKITNPKTCHLQ